MSVVDLNKIGLFTSLKKILRRDVTIYPELPYKGGGFKETLKSGIYQMRRFASGRICTRINFYDYVITHTELQQANREKFGDAVKAWQNLTSEEKSLYNKMALGKDMSGYNLFISKTMYG